MFQPQFTQKGLPLYTIVRTLEPCGNHYINPPVKEFIWWRHAREENVEGFVQQLTCLLAQRGVVVPHARERGEAVDSTVYEYEERISTVAPGWKELIEAGSRDVARYKFVLEHSYVPSLMASIPTMIAAQQQREWETRRRTSSLESLAAAGTAAFEDELSPKLDKSQEDRGSKADQKSCEEAKSAQDLKEWEQLQDQDALMREGGDAAAGMQDPGAPRTSRQVHVHSRDHSAAEVARISYKTAQEEFMEDDDARFNSAPSDDLTKPLVKNIAEQISTSRLQPADKNTDIDMMPAEIDLDAIEDLIMTIKPRPCEHCQLTDRAMARLEKNSIAHLTRDLFLCLQCFNRKEVRSIEMYEFILDSKIVSLRSGEHAPYDVTFKLELRHDKLILSTAVDAYTDPDQARELELEYSKQLPRNYMAKSAQKELKGDANATKNKKKAKGKKAKVELSRHHEAKEFKAQLDLVLAGDMPLRARAHTPPQEITVANEALGTKGLPPAYLDFYTRFLYNQTVDTQNDAIQQTILM